MQWTDEQIMDIRKLASEGFTRRETADKLGINYDAVQKKSLRLTKRRRNCCCGM